MDVLDSIKKLLGGGPDAPEAWKHFLKVFSPAIITSIKRYEKDYDLVMNKYLFVCTHLLQNDFRILRTFMDENPDFSEKRFAFWLAVVVRNLCIDEHRSRFGRPRLPRLVMSLPERDREVFKMLVWKGLSDSSIEHISPPDKNDPRSGLEVIRDIENIFLESKKKLPQTETEIIITPLEENHMPEPHPSETDQEHFWIEKAVSDLSEREQLVFKLRFWEDTPPKAIAQMLDIEPPGKVYEILQKGFRKIHEWHRKNKSRIS